MRGWHRVAIMVLAGVVALAAAPAEARAPSQAMRAAAQQLPNMELADESVTAPAVAFTGPGGVPARLKDFRGRVVLLNLWATWCPPCVTEMPSLNTLQGRMRNRLVVVAASQNREGEEAVKPFLRKHRLNNLTLYTDPGGSLMEAMGARVLPTSYLIAPDGQVVARLQGDLDWTLPAVHSLIEAVAAAAP